MLIIPMSMIANDPGNQPGNDPKNDSNTHETEVRTDVPARAALMLSADNDAVTVRWQTEADQDNSLYSVQRSSDGESWQPVFSLRCNNKATQGREHAIYDRNLLPGDYTYRVRSINLEGDVSPLRSGRECCEAVKCHRIDGCASKVQIGASQQGW